jgi:hypothetical protein
LHRKALKAAAGGKEVAMPSPFPGMNPYLEQPDAWEDFHLNCIARIQEVLNRQVSPEYFVKAETRLYVHELPEGERRFLGRADVAVAPGNGGAAVLTERTVTAPQTLTLPTTDVERYGWLEIRDRRDRKLITVIEILSPTNKSGADRDEYLWKRAGILASQTHLVEIDLRRGGQRPTPPLPPPCDYYVLVSRAQDRPEMGFWPIGLRESLPVIPVPLAPPDPDALVDLQVILNQVYDACGFGGYVYTGNPEPPLREDDAAWARQFVPA